jgi:hypothetical protein
MTPTDFRNAFPEFSSVTIYPDPMIQAWLTVAVSLVNPLRWAELTNLGIQLVTAHHLALGARDQNAASVGGVPGTMTGPTSAKAVDKVSTSYDTNAAALDGAGFWALTRYGVQYLTMARMFGAGGMQINC